MPRKKGKLQEVIGSDTDANFYKDDRRGWVRSAATEVEGDRRRDAPCPGVAENIYIGRKSIGDIEGDPSPYPVGIPNSPNPRNKCQIKSSCISISGGGCRTKSAHLPMNYSVANFDRI